MNESDTRTKDGKFQKGTSGNPSGRPAGSRNRATLLAEQLLEGQAEQLTQSLVDLAKGGNFPALRFCLERLLPIRKERSTDLELPPAQNPQEVAANLQRIVTALSEGRITAGEAESWTRILAVQSRCLESLELSRVEASHHDDPDLSYMSDRELVRKWSAMRNSIDGQAATQEVAPHR